VFTVAFRRCERSKCGANLANWFCGWNSNADDVGEVTSEWSRTMERGDR